MNKVELPDGLGFRLATPSDAVFIESLLHSLRELFYVAEQEDEYIRFVIDQQLALQTECYGQQTPDAMTFIIEKQGTRIGRLMMDFGPRSAHIVDLAFIKEARGRGYGKAIIQAVQHIAHKQTLPVSLMVERQNQSARNLYLSLGFTQEQATPSHDLMTWLPPANRIYSGI